MTKEQRCDKLRTVKFPALWTMKKLEDYIKDAQDQASLIHVYFKELGIIKYKKDELYGTKDLVGRLRKCHVYRKMYFIRTLFQLLLVVSWAFAWASAF